jgi:hypothetical protein
VTKKFRILKASAGSPFLLISKDNTVISEITQTGVDPTPSASASFEELVKNIPSWTLPQVH